jgi:hypothetical protein
MDGPDVMIQFKVWRILPNTGDIDEQGIQRNLVVRPGDVMWTDRITATYYIDLGMAIEVEEDKSQEEEVAAQAPRETAMVGPAPENAMIKKPTAKSKPSKPTQK